MSWYLPVGAGVLTMLFFVCWLVIPTVRDQREVRRLRAQRVAGIRAGRRGPGELGALVHVFGNERRRQLRTALLASSLGLVVFVVVVGAMVWDLTSSRYSHPVPVGGFGTVAGLAFAVMVTGIGAGARYLRHRDEEFRLHEGGFVHAGARGTRPVLWDDIDAVDPGGGLRWGPAGKVRLRGGGRVVISGTIRHGPGLVGLIRGAVYEGRQPRRATTPGG